MNNANIIWKYHVEKFWTGNTIEQLEYNMQHKNPSFHVSCTIEAFPKVVSQRQKYLLIAGLLLKLEDLMYLPVCEQIAIHGSTQAPPVLPSYVKVSDKKYI